MTAYKDRRSGTNSDGTATFATAGDEHNQARFQRLLSLAQKCKVHSFPKLSPIDLYAVKHERVVAFIEFKARTCTVKKHSTIWLNFRKYTALYWAKMAFGVPAYFYVSFSGGEILFIEIDNVDSKKHRMGGCAEYVKSQFDKEPVIEVPIADMKWMTKKPA